jgi:hypothetical protein
MSNKNLEKPITLVREDFINNIIDTCNNSGLPFFMIEYIMKDLIQQIHVAAQQQLEEDRKKYQKELEKK